MSDFLSDARDGLKALLEDSYRVHERRPEGITPTAIVIESDTNYVTPGSTWGDWTVTFTLSVFVDHGINAKVIRKGDSIICDVIERLRGEWNVSNVDTGIADVGDSQFYLVSINITNTVSI